MKRDTEITMQDIADKTGYSRATVSRALQNHPHVNLKTKQLVKDAAKRLGYRYNAIAAGLRKNKSNTIGLIVPRIGRYYQASVITAIQSKLYDSKYHVIVCQSNESPELERELVAALYASRVEGLIVSSTLHTTDFSAFDSFSDSSCPLVFFDRAPGDYPAHKVIGDDFRGGWLATQHLLEQGCRRIVHIGGAQTCNIYSERYKGYKEALKQYNVDLDESIVFFHDLTTENAVETMEKLLKSSPLPDAIFAGNDTVAVALVHHAKKLGIKIPKDMKIVGYSNDPSSQVIDPSVTSIEQHPHEVGSRAAALILELIKNKAVAKENFMSVEIPVELVIRNSSTMESIDTDQ